MSFDQNKSLLLSLEKSDVTLVIGDIELPAHRSILSERSEYFKTMFSSSFIEADLDKITLKETDLKAFISIMEYIYTGTLEHLDNAKLATDDVFEVLACARFYMVDELPPEIISYIKNAESKDYWLLLKNAFHYDVDDVILYCTDMIRRGEDCYGSWIFDKMSPLAVEHLLKLPLDTTESKIIEALVIWMRENMVYSSVFPKLLEYIEVHLVEETHLDMLFEPEKLIDRAFVQNLLSQQQEKTQMVQKIVNQNVNNGTYDIRIINGIKNYFNEDETSFIPKENNVIVDLEQQYLLNCIKLNLRLDMFYAVSVSKDTRDWDRVIGYSKCKCSGQQVLYFKERAFRFIRIHCPSSIDTIKALYSTDTFEIDPETSLIVPDQNMVPTNLFHNYYYETKVRCVDGKICYDHVEHMLKSNNNGIVVQLNQPYMIGSAKLLLNFTSSYYIAISTDKRRWTRVFEEENVCGWRIAIFPKQPVVFIKVFGTKAPFKCFKLYKLECPAI